MLNKFIRLTDYLNYLEDSIYQRSEVDARDFLNFEPKVGTGDISTVSYTSTGLTFTVNQTSMFLGGYSHLVDNLSYTLPANTLCYVYLEKGSGRDDIIISHTTTELQNSFNKIYIAKIQTGASTLTTVDLYSVTPFGSFTSYEKMSSYETTVTIGANSSYNLNFSSMANIDLTNKSFLDMSIQYVVYNTGTSSYQFPYPNIVQSLNSIATILTITNNNATALDVTITIMG